MTSHRYNQDIEVNEQGGTERNAAECVIYAALVILLNREYQST